MRERACVIIAVNTPEKGAIVQLNGADRFLLKIDDLCLLHLRVWRCSSQTQPERPHHQSKHQQSSQFALPLKTPQRSQWIQPFHNEDENTTPFFISR